MQSTYKIKEFIKDYDENDLIFFELKQYVQFKLDEYRKSPPKGILDYWRMAETTIFILQLLSYKNQPEIRVEDVIKSMIKLDLLKKKFVECFNYYKNTLSFLKFDDLKYTFRKIKTNGMKVSDRAFSVKNNEFLSIKPSTISKIFEIINENDAENNKDSLTITIYDFLKLYFILYENSKLNSLTFLEIIFKKSTVAIEKIIVDILKLDPQEVEKLIENIDLYDYQSLISIENGFIKHINEVSPNKIGNNFKEFLLNSNQSSEAKIKKVDINKNENFISLKNSFLIKSEPIELGTRKSPLVFQTKLSNKRPNYEDNNTSSLEQILIFLNGEACKILSKFKSQNFTIQLDVYIITSFYQKEKNLQLIFDELAEENLCSHNFVEIKDRYVLIMPYVDEQFIQILYKHIILNGFVGEIVKEGNGLVIKNSYIEKKNEIDLRVKEKEIIIKEKLKNYVNDKKTIEELIELYYCCSEDICDFHAVLFFKRNYYFSKEDDKDLISCEKESYYNLCKEKGEQRVIKRINYLTNVEKCYK